MFYLLIKTYYFSLSDTLYHHLLSLIRASKVTPINYILFSDEEGKVSRITKLKYEFYPLKFFV